MTEPVHEVGGPRLQGRGELVPGFDQRQAAGLDKLAEPLLLLRRQARAGVRVHDEEHVWVGRQWLPLGRAEGAEAGQVIADAPKGLPEVGAVTVQESLLVRLA